MAQCGPGSSFKASLQLLDLICICIQDSAILALLSRTLIAVSSLNIFFSVKNFVSVQPCFIQVTVLREGKLPMFAFCTENNNVGSTNEEKEGCFHRKHVAYVPSENAKKLWLPALNLTGCCQNRSIANKSKERFAKNTGRADFALHEWRTVGK